MAILVCQVCDAQDIFTDFQHPYIRDSLGRIAKEGPWTFDPETGRCVRDETKPDARPDPYDCDICWDDPMVVYSTEPPPGASAPDVQGSEQHVWKLRPGEKPCTCKEGCYLQWSGVGGCGCANNGGACSVLCGCGGRADDSNCMSPYTPPPDADPGNTSCECVGGCFPYRTRSGRPCTCSSLAIGCTDTCGCRGSCHRG
ncbi:hypothetical protein ARMGADRAFT_1057255 [Armillaria gallica]|uniref:Uncharacterized protein n=1 Tax=Armillaria gallica TaxID=47427 RepID=A0A2H3EAY9_ARMGA|nr:hypothetical protein ARMGADRAFT_1057255 [Armillaria gallica]